MGVISMSNELEFKPKARMLLQLGDQLIRSESIALLELVKNAYDANANSATISMSKLDSPSEGEIIIEDDGDGMDKDILQNVWMQPGSDYKDKLVKSGKIKEGKRTPIGGKGIGRFGVHKLGEKIELISKREGKPEVKLEIDWNDFYQDKLLQDIKISFTENETPQIFKSGKTGTKIVIRDLKSKWDRGTVRDLYRSVTSLNPPFGASDPFRAIFKLDNSSWLKGLTRFSDIKNQALYHITATIRGDEIETLHYEFCPWDTMTKLSKRTKTFKNIKMIENVIDDGSKRKKQVRLDLSKHKIGPINIELLVFDRSSKILSLGVSDKKGLKEYLDANGGMRVYRNDIRVYDYGEPGNDWLNLDMMRVNQPGKTISNNLIIGAVKLDLKSSSDLQEKTNREGFIENEAYRKFVSSIRFFFDKSLTQRNIDKEKVRKFYSPSSANEPVIAKLKSLYIKIKETITDTELSKSLLRSIESIEKDYETISEIYTRSSSAGLSLSIVMHEIIHMISELSAAVDEQPTDKRVRNLVKMLQKTAGDYAGVIKQSNKTNSDIGEITNQALSNIQFRIRAHEVELIEKYKERTKIDKKVRCAQNLLTSTLINIVDNSIWWQTYGDIAKKKIFIDIVEYPKDHVGILIADNGPGFTIAPEEAIRPFISDKPGGMGLGLHLADEVMKGQKGSLIFPDPVDFDLPSDFKSGALILLALRKK